MSQEMDMERGLKLRLPPHYRRHALARLDSLIARFERQWSETRDVIGQSGSSAKTAHAWRSRLQVLDYRLRLLRLTKRSISAGELP